MYEYFTFNQHSKSLLSVCKKNARIIGNNSFLFKLIFDVDLEKLVILNAQMELSVNTNL